MKSSAVVIGAVIALLLTWWLLRWKGTTEMQVLQPVAVVEPDAPSVGPLFQQESADEENLYAERESAEVGEPVATTDSCVELRQRADAASMSFAFAADVVPDESGCATMMTMLFGARVSAIPGFTGFEVRDMGERSPRAILANEVDDPEWSRAMEGAILTEITPLLDFQITTLHVACRSSTCGLLFAYRNADHHGGNYNVFAARLADELGFSGFHGGHSRGMDGNGFTYIYLGDWITQRPANGFERPLPDAFGFEASLRDSEHE